jgi:hypothetical protein
MGVMLRGLIIKVGPVMGNGFGLDTVVRHTGEHSRPRLIICISI